MERITVVLPSILTVPAVKGGAVEQLLENFINQNEITPCYYFDIVAKYDAIASEKSTKYKYSSFHYINCPEVLIRANSVIFNKLKLQDKNEIWDNLIIKKVRGLGNRIILVEGGNIALKIAKSVPESKIYFHIHSNWPVPQSLLQQVNESLNIICVSEYIRKKQIEQGVLPNKLITVLNGIDTVHFSKKNIRDDRLAQEYGIPKNSFVILFKGRLVREKGIVELIKAFNKMEKKDAYLLIAGSINFGQKRIRKSEYEKEIIDLVKDNENIIITGYVDYEKMLKLHSISDVAVVPSLWEEPLGLTVIEALVSKIPLITTKKGGIPELCKDTNAIVLDVDENFIDSLKKSLLELYNNRGRLEMMKDISKDKLEYFSNKRYFDELCQVLAD